MITARFINGFLQVCFMDDTCRVSPSVVQIRSSVWDLEKIRDMGVSIIERYYFCKENYHDDRDAKIMFDRGFVEVLKTDSYPIIFVVREVFNSLQIHFSDRVLTDLTVNDLIDFNNALTKAIEDYCKED